MAALMDPISCNRLNTTKRSLESALAGSVAGPIYALTVSDVFTTQVGTPESFCDFALTAADKKVSINTPQDKKKEESKDIFENMYK